MDQNQNNTTDTRLNEALSALMDGEVDELELRRILREMPARPELAAAWKRYHAVRASLNLEVHANPRVDLLAGIQASLAAEAETAAFVPARNMLQSRFVRYVGQGAVAATVAVAVLMGVSFMEVADDSANAPALAIADAGPTVNGEFNAEQTRTVSFDAEAFDRLQQAVYRELSERPQAIPVSYNPEFPAELSSD
ncbi:MAG: sigma-E factor negative regulatory protein [Pseudomonadota bacterium]|nr:sigma-E factor negative regulatory protein [Pseudomonadota bacterium]